MKFFVFIFYFIMLPSLVHATEDLPSPALHLVENSFENSVVMVTTDRSTHGIGHFIDKNTVVTTVDVLLNGIDASEPIYVKNTLGKARVTRITHLSILNNLAVLKVTDHPAPPLSAGSMSSKDKSYVLDFDSERWVKIIGNGTQFHDGLIFFFFDNKIDPTNPSGSPIFNKKGQVIGISISITKNGLYIGTSIENLQTLLNQPVLPNKPMTTLMHEEFNDNFETLLIQDHVGAQFRFGHILSSGIGLKQNSNEGFEWYREAAKQDHAFAQCLIGGCYVEDEDYAESLLWLQKSAKQGFSGAYALLGFLFFKGYGTTENVHQGIQWLQKAAELGDNRALDFLKDIAEAGNVQAQKAIPSIVHTISNRNQCERNFISIQ